MNSVPVNPRLFMVGSGESGFFLRSCPWALLMSPAITEIADLYWWRESGGVAWDSVPVATRHAISAYARGVAAATDQKFRDDQKKSRN